MLPLEEPFASTSLTASRMRLQVGGDPARMAGDLVAFDPDRVKESSPKRHDHYSEASPSSGHESWSWDGAASRARRAGYEGAGLQETRETRRRMNRGAQAAHQHLVMTAWPAAVTYSRDALVGGAAVPRRTEERMGAWWPRRRAVATAWDGSTARRTSARPSEANGIAPRSSPPGLPAEDEDCRKIAAATPEPPLGWRGGWSGSGPPRRGPSPSVSGARESVDAALATSGNPPRPSRARRSRSTPRGPGVSSLRALSGGGPRAWPWGARCTSASPMEIPGTSRAQASYFPATAAHKSSSGQGGRRETRSGSGPRQPNPSIALRARAPYSRSLAAAASCCAFSSRASDEPRNDAGVGGSTNARGRAAYESALQGGHGIGSADSGQGRAAPPQVGPRRGRRVEASARPSLAQPSRDPTMLSAVLGSRPTAGGQGRRDGRLRRGSQALEPSKAGPRGGRLRGDSERFGPRAAVPHRVARGEGSRWRRGARASSAAAGLGFGRAQLRAATPRTWPAAAGSASLRDRIASTSRSRRRRDAGARGPVSAARTPAASGGAIDVKRVPRPSPRLYRHGAWWPDGRPCPTACAETVTCRVSQHFQLYSAEESRGGARSSRVVASRFDAAPLPVASRARTATDRRLRPLR